MVFAGKLLVRKNNPDNKFFSYVLALQRLVFSLPWVYNRFQHCLSKVFIRGTQNLNIFDFSFRKYAEVY
jgi:hypothetical protein